MTWSITTYSVGLITYRTHVHDVRVRLVVRTRRVRGRRRGVAAARGAAPATGGRRVNRGVHGCRSRPGRAHCLCHPPPAKLRGVVLHGPCYITFML
jgi:hypothetical protein